MNAQEFTEAIWEKALQLYRDMPWRDNTDPYYILVSELMLQQTQVDRVIPKFELFMHTFPTILDVAKAPLSDVLTVWSGLGYNRRAKFLHATAKKVVSDFQGVIPDRYDALLSLPGVGPNTAGAILVYSFNQPVVFIETNVRTVYFHHFFHDQALVSDKELKELIEQTIDTEHPREWYWGLMDYGAYLKKNGAGRIDKSRHYKKQAPLKGSVREVRGLILKALSKEEYFFDELRRSMPHDKRFEIALQALLKEGLITQTDDRLHLTKT
ncbi:MAG: A/G-specific adenine glycosylase [Candidatus Microsaccharimonas sossegonensis]|uniref:Adenine DNA glycosylase n=1 Tax=Candidatus Microsaccharimonas sossegonensis TaxID=2506948 RepID=A0A4Q0AGM0_9BACT|nr:MAG: A/G-specific adenine glycosylase [Candidatus Microsaccharimonas sossegonensis]